MKRIIAFMMGCSIAIASHAQGVFTNDVNSALQKVIQDYPNHFINLRGPRIHGDLRTVQYHSNVEIPGSVNCVLTPKGSSPTEKYSWKCLVMESDKFPEAKSKFVELYNQIRNTIMKIEGEKPFILNGNYEAPTDDRKFTSIILQLLPATGEMQKLKVEITLQQTLSNWRLSLAVYDEDRRNDQQPDLTDKD